MNPATMKPATQKNSGSTIAPPPSNEHGPPPGRVGPDTADRILSLSDLAMRGLARMYTEDGFVQTARGIRTVSDTGLRLEGVSTRYTAIAALGLHQLSDNLQRKVLHGRTAEDLLDLTDCRSRGSSDTGAVALSVWASGEITGSADAHLCDDLRRRYESGTPLATLDVAWSLTAALAARRQFDSDLVSHLTERLLSAQGPGGLFPHTVPGRAGRRLRRHVGSFADQVYPIQALARAAAATDDRIALSAANACAERICALQGAAGQWWWHYDARGSAVVEPYPVYSVHQHAMAPLALFDLVQAGGDDHAASIELGVDWLYRHPETMADLICESHDVVWRKVGRREPRRAARSIAAATTALCPGARVPGLDRVFPAEVVDYECRPYELGWLLYAWLPRNEAGGSDDQQ